MKKYNHIGIPTTEKKEGEVHLPHLKMFVTDHEKSPNKIQWIRFEDDAPCFLATLRFSFFSKLLGDRIPLLPSFGL